MNQRQQPNGQFRMVAIDDLFFSTTDHKGVITGANSVFQRLSAFPRSELMGSPHNVIRHPAMPGGAFRLMWERLEARRPFAAYVRNLAKDGYSYWVFATITPLGDGFLSVRSTPCAQALWQAASDLYDASMPYERAARQAGRNRAQSAVAGRDELAQRLRQAGFESYEEFMFTALPAEAMARVALSRKQLARPEAQGEVAEVLRAAVALRDRLDHVLSRLDSLHQVADALGRVALQLSGTLGSLTQVTAIASESSQRVETRAPILASTARAMGSLGVGVEGTIRPLAERLREVKRKVMELRFLIALAHLHDDMVISFAVEVLDGFAPPEGLSYVPMLCQALSDDIASMAQELELMGRSLGDVARQIDASSGQFGQFQKLLTAWRIQVPRYGMSQTLGPLVGPIDARLSHGHEELAALKSLAVQCEREARPVDRAALQQPIDAIAQVTSRLLAGPSRGPGGPFSGSGRAAPPGRWATAPEGWAPAPVGWPAIQ
ncbi:MAG: PAS domain-containing protein [Bifidobacteriaceae bacterium]|jgi:aerotaxis receptor|nr:PAS domain-containing protein [Bifidobacteriaceae bacterium]